MILTEVRKLTSECRPPSLPAFFVHHVALIMADRIGEYVGPCLREPIEPGNLIGEDIIKNTWGDLLDSHLSHCRVEGDDSSGFFGAILRGVFCFKKPCAEDILALRKKLASVFLEKWFASSPIFRTVTWELPEMNKYRDGRIKFGLRSLISDLLGQSNSSPVIGKFWLELCAHTFEMQIGVVRVNKDGVLALSVYGDFGRRRVYIACNGLERHLQKFYYFSKGKHFL